MDIVVFSLLYSTYTAATRPGRLGSLHRSRIYLLVSYSNKQAVNIATRYASRLATAKCAYADASINPYKPQVSRYTAVPRLSSVRSKLGLSISEARTRQHPCENLMKICVYFRSIALAPSFTLHNIMHEFRIDFEGNHALQNGQCSVKIPGQPLLL